MTSPAEDASAIRAVDSFPSPHFEDAAVTRAAIPYLNLPPELHRIIDSYIPRPSDLKALCLACKAMRVVAVEFLYRKVDLDLDDYTLEDVKLLFGEHNIGVKSIRALRCSNFRSKVSIKRLCSLLEMLSPDQLEEFDPTNFRPGVDHDLVKILTTQQRNLSSLSLSLGADGYPRVGSEFPWKACIRKLKIRVSHGTSASHVMKVIQSCTKLQEIECYGLEWLEEAGKDTNRSLGSTILPDLEALVLHRTSIKPMALMSNVVNFSLLVKLCLREMQSLNDLLRGLGELYGRGPHALRHLSVKQCDSTADVVRDFLISFTGLQTLYMDIYFDDDPMHILLQGVSHHGQSLRQLYIGPYGWSNGDLGQDVWPMSPADLSSLCRDAPHLRQLGLALPDISMEQAYAGAWGSFGKAIGSLAMLPKISLLHIVSWPLPPREAFVKECCDIDDDDEQPYPRTLLPFLLNKFATLVVRELDRSSMFPCPVVSFGSELRDYGNHRTDTYSYSHGVRYVPTAYVPQLQKDLYGRQECFALAVDGSELQYIEPECEVATFVLDPWLL